MNKKMCSKTAEESKDLEDFRKDTKEKEKMSILPRCPDNYCFEDGM